MAKATSRGRALYPEEVRKHIHDIEEQYGGRSAVMVILGGDTVETDNGRFITLPDFTAQVQRGIKLLDAHDPGWWRHIDTSVLNLKDENLCVLGQAWSHYADGQELARQRGRLGARTNFRMFLARLFPGQATETDENRELSAHYGFNVTGEQGRLLNYQMGFRTSGTNAWALMWEHLTNTWLREIRKRQDEETREDQFQSGAYL